jgi:hypothetical protein
MQEERFHNQPLRRVDLQAMDQEVLEGVQTNRVQQKYYYDATST